MKPFFKYAIVAVCFLFAISPALVHASATGVNILSQSHEVRGAIFYNGVLHEYDIVSDSPVEGRAMPRLPVQETSRFTLTPPETTLATSGERTQHRLTPLK